VADGRERAFDHVARSQMLPVLGREVFLTRRAQRSMVMGILERIKHRRTQASDVSIVARHQRQAIDRCGRREQPIDTGRGLMATMRPH
jgi:hypothetical protein